MSKHTLNEIRNDDGTLPAYAWPGGYTIIYLDAHESVLCAECANKCDTDPDELDSFKPKSWSMYDEGPTIFCEGCNAEIESSYGDPDAEDK